MDVLLIVFLCAALGYAFGNIRFFGIQFGASGILLVALVFGHFGYAVPPVVRDFGLACFVCAVGYIAGPTFFASLRRRAGAYLILGVVIVLTGALTAYALVSLFGIPAPLGVGVFAGALTSSPALGAAVEAAAGDPLVAAGYGIAYPFGVVGVVLFVQLMPKLFGGSLSAAAPDAAPEPKTRRTPRTIDGTGLMWFTLAAALGCVVGGLKVGLPGGAVFSLGTSGGPLLTGLVFGSLGAVGGVSLHVPDKTLSALRELGLFMFLIGAGVGAGQGFAAVLAEYGAGLFLIGIAVTVVPMLVGLWLARHVFKLELVHALGSICGGMTSTPSLGALISAAGSDAPAASYAATYPAALIVVVLAAQVLLALIR